MLIFFVVGLIAELIDGTIGMGYGVTSSTLLIRLGYVPLYVTASVHAAELVTTSLSGIAHITQGNVRPRLAATLLVPGVIGAVLGAMVASAVPGKIIKPYIAVLLFILGSVMVLRFLVMRRLRLFPFINTTLGKMWLGLVAGFVDAVGGGGWGPIATPGLITTSSYEPKNVVGTVNVTEFFVTLAQTLTFFIILGKEPFKGEVVLPLLVGGGIAAFISARLTKRIPAHLLGVGIGIFLMLTNISTILSVIK